MSEQPAQLFLIAHKVRGEPAFDVATRIECAECNGNTPESGHCAECDDFGYWWIVPTSGHRAYPAANWELSTFRLGGQRVIDDLLGLDYSRLPDHYAVRASARAPAQPPSGIAALLATARKRNLPTIDRRGF